MPLMREIDQGLDTITFVKKVTISAREKAYEYLRSSVLSGRFHPGERLAEEHLAKELGISRTPIREALHKLESEGLIKALETRGFIVSLDTKQEVEELFEIRSVLEGLSLIHISEPTRLGMISYAV